MSEHMETPVGVEPASARVTMAAPVKLKRMASAVAEDSQAAELSALLSTFGASGCGVSRAAAMWFLGQGSHSVGAVSSQA